MKQRDQLPSALKSEAQPNSQALLRLARTLQECAGKGAIQPLLRGRNLGLLCESDQTTEAALFRSAATELGARVAHLRPSLALPMAAEELQSTARVLGRLYDAMECEHVSTGLVRSLSLYADVPVYDFIASRGHPLAGLVRQLDLSISTDDKRRLLIQAALMHTIGH